MIAREVGLRDGDDSRRIEARRRVDVDAVAVRPCDHLDAALAVHHDADAAVKDGQAVVGLLKRKQVAAERGDVAV